MPVLETSNRARAPMLPPVGQEARRHDPDRFLHTLFAPAAVREALWALVAFNLEIAKVRETVREPTLGLMRLQWWREALDGVYAGTPRAHPVTQSLALAVPAHDLPRATFERLIDARAADLDPEPPETLDDLARYAGDTAGPLVALTATVLGASLPPETSDAIGRAYGLAGIALAVPFRAAAGRVDLPSDLLEKVGLHAQQVGETTHRAGLRAIVGALRARAEAECAAARRLVGGLASAERPIALPLTSAGCRLRRLAAAGDDPFNPNLGRRDPWLVPRLWWGMRTGRF